MPQTVQEAEELNHAITSVSHEVEKEVLKKFGLTDMQYQRYLAHHKVHETNDA